MEYTSTLKLKKPEGHEKAKISDLNENFDEIDRAIEEVKTAAKEIDFSKITENFEPHLNNKTKQMHISIEDSIPTDLSNSGFIVKVEDSQSDIPSLPTYETLKREVQSELTILKDETAKVKDEANRHSEKVATLTEKGHVNHGNLTTVIGTEWVNESAPYTQVVEVTGLLSTDSPIISPVYSEDIETAILQKEAWNLVSKGEAADNSLSFTCFEDKPEISIPIQIKVVR